MGRVTKFMEKTNMKSVFCAGAGIQSILFFLNDGYLSATLACGSGVSPRTVRKGAIRGILRVQRRAQRTQPLHGTQPISA